MENDFAADNKMRLERAKAWLHQARAIHGKHKRAKEQDKDRLLCEMFVFLWIAFNALYALPRGMRRLPQKASPELQSQDRASEKDRSEIEIIDEFFDFLSKKIGAAAHLLVNREIKDTIEKLTTMIPVYQGYWEGSINWQAQMRRQNNSILVNIRRNQIKALKLIFRRLYVVRNQVFHGAHTIGQSVGQKQIKLSVLILHAILPEIRKMMEKKSSSVDWGPVPFPRMSALDKPPRYRKFGETR